jgi:integrase
MPVYVFFVTPLLPCFYTAIFQRFMKVHESNESLYHARLLWWIKGLSKLKQKTMGIHLREKKLGDGQISFYLDIYHNKKRWYEFLDIHISKTRLTQQDKDKKRLAQEIRAKRENELIVMDNGLTDKTKRKADFVEWYTQFIKERKHSCYRSTLIHLKAHLDGSTLPFNTITPEWIKGFTKYLLTKVSNNTAGFYIKNISAALDEAARQDIIPQNPVRKIPRQERLKHKQVFRNCFTMEELQLLIDTPCEMEPQFRQAFMYSCFTGLRWSDVNKLRWPEIVRRNTGGREEWFIYFEQEKTEDIEYLPLSEQAVSILQDREREQAESGIKSIYVFPMVKDPDPARRLLSKKVDYYLKKWAVAAGIDPKRMHFHSSRHTFATNVLESSPDGDLLTVSKLLGHKSIQSTMVYTHVRDNKKRAAVTALPMLKKAQDEAA